MLRQMLILGSCGLLIIAALSGCSKEVAKADLVTVGSLDSNSHSLCNLVKEGVDKGKLVVTVKNQGNVNAPDSTTRVEFGFGGSFQLPTPAITSGGFVELPPLSIPATCYNPDCEFKITVDFTNRINESSKDNNKASGICRR